MTSPTVRARNRSRITILAILGFCVATIPGGEAVRPEEDAPPPIDDETEATSSEVLDLAVDEVQVVPGSSGALVVRSLNGLSLSRVHLALVTKPVLFTDNPVMELAGPDRAGSVALAAPSPGAYDLDLDGSTTPFNATAGILVRLSGTVRQDLPIESTVYVRVDASAVAATGETVLVNDARASLRVVDDAPPVALRVDSDSRFIPGSAAVVVMSSLNPKPISQGQVCILFNRAAFESIDSVAVHGAEPDVSFRVDLNAPGMILLQFVSPSASVNRFCGPVITLRMTVNRELLPGTQTTVGVDLSHTLLLDQELRPALITAGSGTFTIEPQP